MTSTTSYLGGLEEATNDGTTTTLTKYFSVPGLPTAMRVGSTLSYLASDGLGSVSEALDGSGAVTAQQLYAPYGGTRYMSGVMPTTKGYTGQRQDAVSGLDYYGARYYDPVLGQFTSADSAADGLNRYGYVHGNPTTGDESEWALGDCWGGRRPRSGLCRPLQVR
jgi:RHS repeat-associated protein